MIKNPLNKLISSSLVCIFASVAEIAFEPVQSSYSLQSPFQIYQDNISRQSLKMNRIPIVSKIIKSNKR